MSGPWEQYQAAPAGGKPWEQYAAAPTGATSADIPTTTTGLGSNRTATKTAPAAPQGEDNWLGKAFGLVEAPITLVTGLAGSIAGAVRGGPLAIPFSKAKDAKALEEEGGRLAESLTYQPRTQTGQSIVGAVGKGLQDSGIAGLPIGPELIAATRLAAPAMYQAGQAASAAVAPEVFMAKNLAGKMANTSLVPRVSQETAQLASKAEQFGMKLTPDMLSKNKFGRIAGETMAKVPLSGANTEANQAAFNRSLIKMIGGDDTAHALTPDVFGEALTKVGEKIGEVSSRTKVPLDEGFTSALARHVEDVVKFNTEDNARIVGNYVAELQNKAAQNGGVIDGTAFRTLNSAIGKRIRGADGDLKHALGGLQESMMDALERNIADPADLTALLDARKKYAIAKTIEPLVAKATEGNISPAGLMGRVTSDGARKTRMATGHGGDLGDLARVGQQFLKEPGSSNTAERGLTYGLMGGGAVMHLPTTAGVFTAANLYNRLSPILARKMVQKSLPPRVPPVSFGNELSLLDESPFAARPAAGPAAPPYRGLLSLADDSDIAARAPVLDTQRMATTHDYPTMDFPLRQEVLQQPEIAGAIDAFRTEAARLGKIRDHAINPMHARKAAAELAKLEDEFAAGMKQLGISNAADAHGLNRPLYETGNGTRLPIKTTELNR